MTRKICVFSRWETEEKRGELSEKKNTPAANVLRIQQLQNSTEGHGRSPVPKPLGNVTDIYKEKKDFSQTMNEG